MSEFKISCPNCQQHLLCNDSYRGAQFPCPTCGTVISVPPAAVAPPPSGLKISAAAPEPAPAPRPHIPPRPQISPTPRGKSWLTTFLLSFFLGGLGIDRFYNGRTGLGIGKLLTGGLCGLWTLIDVLLLLFRKYEDAQGNYLRPAQRSHMVVALSMVGVALLVNVILVGSAVHKVKSEFAKLTSTGTQFSIRTSSSEGFASPEAVFEAMKLNPNSIELLPPDERPMMAYMLFMMTRIQVAMQTDATKKQSAEKEFTALVEKYHLGDKLEMNASSTMEQDQAMATEAFANVDLISFMDELDSFAKKFSSEHLSMDEEATPVSMKGLKLEGNKASATVLYSDDTEQPADFVKLDDRWFQSMARQMQAEEGEDMSEGVSLGLSLIITFDSQASLRSASAKGLLAGVDYDRSLPATLTPTGKPLQANLSYYVEVAALREPGAKEAMFQKLKRANGVKSVEEEFAHDMREAANEIRDELQQGRIRSGR